MHNPINEKLDSLKSFIKTQIKSELYRNSILKMESKMVNLKNDNWLEENEEEITLKEFRKSIIISSIVF